MGVEIDFAAVSVYCINHFKDFNVLSLPGSDHLPIEVNLEFGTTAVGREGIFQ